MRVHIVAVHGIGQGPRCGFSRPLRRLVMAELERRAPQLAASIRGRPFDHFWREARWDKGLPNEDLFRKLYPYGDPMPGWARALFRRLGLPTYREFAFYHVGDIFGYLGRREAILDGLQKTVERILEEHARLAPGPREAYLTLVAHSMGSVVAFDFLHEAQYERGEGGVKRAEGARLAVGDQGSSQGVLVAAGLFTLGSPLALFSLLPDARSHHYRGGGGPPFRLAPGGGWYNFYDEEDVVSFPVKGIFGEIFGPMVEVEDVVVDNSRLPLLALLRSHSGYWTSATVARKLAEHIISLEGEGGV